MMHAKGIKPLKVNNSQRFLCNICNIQTLEPPFGETIIYYFDKPHFSGTPKS